MNIEKGSSEGKGVYNHRAVQKSKYTSKLVVYAKVCFAYILVTGHAKKRHCNNKTKE